MKRRYSDFLSTSAATGPSTMEDNEQANGQSRPTGSLINAGTTPLWHSSQLHPAESAMRSTLPSPDCIMSMPAPLQRPLSPATPRLHATQGSDRMSINNLIHPSSTFTPMTSADNKPYHSGFMAINTYKLSRPRKAPVNTATYSLQTGRFKSDMNIDMNQIDSLEVQQRDGTVLQVDHSLTVDKGDGRVWHLGNTNDSFSGTFIHDDPEEIYTHARHLANRIREERERPERMALTAQLLDRVRNVVNGKGVISVERTSHVEFGEPVICERPGCFHKAQLPADAYYVNVGWELYLCLRCFEMLWAGNFTDTVLESDPLRRDSAIAFTPAQSDGPADCYREAPRRSARLKSNPSAMQPKVTALSPTVRPTNELLQSRWAVPEARPQVESPVHTPVRQSNKPVDSDQIADEPVNDSPSSTNSKGEWVYPPVAMQHIAYRLEAGATLTETDKAVFVMWQGVSHYQLKWNRHLLKTQMTRDYYDGLTSEDEGLHLEPLREARENYHGVMEDLNAKVGGLRSKDFYGRDLSFMLKEAAQKKKVKA